MEGTVWASTFSFIFYKIFILFENPAEIIQLTKFASHACMHDIKKYAIHAALGGQ